MSDIPRVCATCKHFVFHESEPDYSEFTPGSDCSFSCSKGYWHANGSDCTEAEFRSSMLAATHCLDYEMVEVPLPAFEPWFPHGDVDSLLVSLRARYPDYDMGIKETQAYYERGKVGRTRSGWTGTDGLAYLWLVTRLAEKEVPSAVEADRIDV
jgi:hypothetical protein